MRIGNLRALAAALAFLPFPLALRPVELPELPKFNLSDFVPAIRKQVQQADAAARARPTSATASGNLGMVLDAYKQYEAAALCYERAHQLDPRSFRWAYYLGTAQAHQGKYVQAAATLRAALRLKPDYLPAQLKLAESLLAAGKLEESSAIYEAILKSDPDSVEALYGRGRIEAARGQTSAAMESFLKACELFPSYGAAQYALALAYSKLGERGKAQPHFGIYKANMTVTPQLEDSFLADVQALDLSAEPHIRRGIDLEQQGKIDESIREHERAIEIDPANVQAHINLISLYGRVGQIAKAEEQYQTAVRLDPNRADAYYDDGVLLFGQGKYADAEKAFRRALDINPYYAEAHNNLGFLFERQGRTKDALAEYEASVENQPQYRLAHYHIAAIMMVEKKYDEAIEHLLKTLTPEDETTPSYLYALAIAYGRKGDRENALKYAHLARSQAAARRQTQLVARIDRDLGSLEEEEKPQ